MIGTASRALAAGDPLTALNWVALRNEAPALALRGIAMAQLGDLVRGKALLKRAARAFGPKDALAQARCIVAEAEIALVSRDLSWPAKALSAARATLEEHGDRVNSAYARYLEVRHLLLIGRLDDADKQLAELDPAHFPPAFRAAYELIIAGSSIRRLEIKTARAALTRAGHAARLAAIPALIAEVESTSLVLETPAARLIARGEERLLFLQDVGALLTSKALVIDTSCATLTPWSRWRDARCYSRSRVRSVKPGQETCREPRWSHGHSEGSAPTNRIAHGCESKSGAFAKCCEPWRALARRCVGLPWYRAGRLKSSF
jgi:hypothetical protein